VSSTPLIHQRALGNFIASECDAANTHTGAQVLRLKKLKGPTQIAAAAKHNKRAGGKHWRGAERIDRSQSHLNYSLAGPSTPEGVALLHAHLFKTAGLKAFRKNAVRAIEAVISLPRDLAVDRMAYFTDVLRFLAETFGGSVNIVSADVHLDEGSPHMHVLIVPLFDGRLRGSDAIGGPVQLSQMLDRFHAEVGAKYGLLRFSAVARQRGARRELPLKTVGNRPLERDELDQTLCSVGRRPNHQSGNGAASSAGGAQ
jgi:hypothetical protein